MEKYSPEGTIFFGGDQLTTERFRSLQKQRANGNRSEKWGRMKFFSLEFHLLINLADVRKSTSSFDHKHNTTQDPHLRYCLLQGFLQRHGKASSNSQFHVMEWLHRKMPAEAKDDTNKVDDFFNITFQGMVIALASAFHGFEVADGFPIDSNHPINISPSKGSMHLQTKRVPFGGKKCLSSPFFERRQ